MRRRSYLRTAGVAAAVSVAGCLGGDDGGGGQAANEFGYPTEETDGVAVPLVPIEDAYEWHQEGILFADARSTSAYERSHVAGAVFSPAPDGQQPADPVEAESTSTRVVTYCGCPHHLSTMRAASLIEAGYANTYALDEGFRPWLQGEYPVEGTDVENIPDGFAIEGRADPSLAGERVWVRHDPTGQREVTDIEPDGTFAMDVYFYEVGPETNVRLTTPDTEVVDTLASLSSGLVDV